MNKKILSCFLVFSFISIMILFNRSEKAFGEYESMLLWYKLDEISGTKVVDSSGNDRDGFLKGGAVWEEGIGENCLRLDGKDGCVVLPDNILEDVDDITITSMVKLDSTATPPQWLTTFGNTSSGYIYFAPDLANEFRYAITKTNWSGESRVSTDPIETDVWRHVAVTFSSETKDAILYIDGEKAGSSNVTIKPSELGDTDANYIGKPWPNYPDHYFNGYISDFRLYSKTLDEKEIFEISNKFSKEIVKLDKESLELGNTSQITKNIVLPNVGENGSVISWFSSSESVVTSKGIVNRPVYGNGNMDVELTAIISRGDVSEVKVFYLTVIELLDGEDQSIANAKDELNIPNADDIRGNITLPNSIEVGKEVVDIEWKTNRIDVVNVNEQENKNYDNIPVGVVTRQCKDTKVFLKAILSHGESTGIKKFKLTVKSKSSLVTEKDYGGYLFAYFSGTNRVDAEQIYFAYSKDGLNWYDLNGNNPVLMSGVGDKGVRDPFILRSPEGDKFYMVATDLRIANGEGWSAAQRNGSKSIVVWESGDLVNWSEERLVKVARDDAGCSWAPEFIYDNKTGEYIVYWASRIGEDNYSKQRIYMAKTRDFYTFTKPEVYIERSLDVIDTTIIEEDGMYYRFSKDEVNKNIIIDKCDQLLGKEFEILSSESVESQSGVEGPTIFKFIKENKWCLLLDNYGGSGYYPMVSDDISSGEFEKLDSSEYFLPTGPRHGTVIKVTKKEYNDLKEKWCES